MPKFTDSPYEVMMKQKPYSGRPPEVEPPLFLSGDKCNGCPYGQAKPCMGICLKDLQTGGKKDAER